jgi:hypothetical protein
VPPAARRRGRHLTADKTAALLRRICPTDLVGVRRRPIARELLAGLRALDRKIAPVDAVIALNARRARRHADRHRRDRPHPARATIIAVTGDPARFLTAASFAGTAPTAAARATRPS